MQFQPKICFKWGRIWLFFALKYAKFWENLYRSFTGPPIAQFSTATYRTMFLSRVEISLQYYGPSTV